MKTVNKKADAQCSNTKENRIHPHKRALFGEAADKAREQATTKALQTLVLLDNVLILIKLTP